MSYSTEIVMNEGVKETITTYDNMYHSDILDIFDELSYRILKPYTIMEHDYSEVRTSSYSICDNKYRFQVWLGQDVVLDELYGTYYSSDMLYKLNEYQTHYDENKEEEEDEGEEEVEEEELEEEEVYEITINGILHFTTNEVDGKVYSSTEDGDVGDEVGSFVNGKIVFNK